MTWLVALTRPCFETVMMDYDSLIDLLIALRTEAGDSQAALASKLGVHQVTVSTWERRSRRIPIEHLMAWLDVYDHSLAVGSGEQARGGLLADLLVRAASLDDDQLDALVRIAGSIGSLPGRARGTIVDLVGNLVEQPVAESA